MTTTAMRVLGILVLAYLIGACTRVGHIRSPARDVIDEYWKTLQDCAAQAKAAG